MSWNTITFDLDERRVGTLTLNRADKRNAMSAEMIAELTELATDLSHTRAARVVVLRGAGKVFCAGGDLTWMHDQIAANREGRMREARKLAMMLKALNELPMPLIGAVHADAYGGGLGLIAVCDSVVADKAARFAFTETKLGLIPATISPYVIGRMGEGSARRVFMSAARFDAHEALGLGLVRKVADSQTFEQELATEVEPYLNVSPEAVARSKQLARALGPEISADIIEQTIEALANAWETEDAAKGIAAFLEKRAHDWR